MVSFLCGATFAVGLALAGMTRPGKVVAFLDFAGDWDPSLALVMGAAIAVYMPLFRLVISMRSPFLARMFDLPSQMRTDWRLVSGAALFGIGWGLAGYCPGPALASAATGATPALVLVASMAAGMVTWGAIDRRLRERVPRELGADTASVIP